MKIFWHKHHLIPRYEGGSNRPANLVRVNVAMHAFLHYLRFRELGDYRDELAYKGLKGEWSKQEITYRLRIQGSEKGLKKARAASVTWRLNNPEEARAICLRSLKLASTASQTPENQLKRNQAIRGGIENLSKEERLARFSHPKSKEDKLKVSQTMKLKSKFIGFCIDGVDYWGRSYGDLATQFGLTGDQFRCAVKKNSKKHWGQVDLCHLNLDLGLSNPAN